MKECVVWGGGRSILGVWQGGSESQANDLVPGYEKAKGA
jgi:hypothetical protein